MAYNFLSHHLKLKAGNVPYKYGYDESFVNVLSKDELKNFNDKNPWPENTLVGYEAIIKYLGFSKKGL